MTQHITTDADRMLKEILHEIEVKLVRAYLTGYKDGRKAGREDHVSDNG